MNKGSCELYRAKHFATLAGVTVRALHHYDRMRLLRPKQRSQAGYRLYSDHDFARLEQNRGSQISRHAPETDPPVA